MTIHITLSTQRRDDRLELSVAGDVLSLNGAALDLSAIPEGASLPATAVDCDWITGEITREGGILALTLVLPHGANAPDETLFPQPITVTVDGPVALPPYDIEETDA